MGWQVTAVCPVGREEARSMRARESRTLALILRDGPLDRRVQAVRSHDPRSAVATNPQASPVLSTLGTVTHQLSHSTVRKS